MGEWVKTITLDDEAYARLKTWVLHAEDSFSAVVKRIVPEAGTLGAMERFVARRVADAEKDGLMESSIEQRTPATHNPWT